MLLKIDDILVATYYGNFIFNSIKQDQYIFHNIKIFQTVE